MMSGPAATERPENETRLDIHNSNIDEDVAERGLCGTRDLATGRTCQLTALHPDGCDFADAGGTPRRWVAGR
jgi:hypothetical protein